jgi:hypothetical protein
VTVAPRTHRRLEFPRPDRAIPDYVNLYQFGSPAVPGPLLLYVGGIITGKEHAERYLTEPAPILEQFDAAFSPTPLARLDLVIAPSPPGPTESAGVLDAYEDFFFDNLLPAIGGPPHTALAFIGYSNGAHLVTNLALGEERALALVTIGGSGIAEAAKAAGRTVAERLSVVMFHNKADGLPQPSTAMKAFDPRLKPRAMPPRPGGHDFHFYAANGSVVEAFGIALALLQ